MLAAAVLFAAVAANGTLVEEAPCPPYPAATYDAYLTGARRAYAEEAEAARRENHELATPLALLTREQFAQRQKEAETVDCRHIKYLSDGLKVSGYIWKPKNAAGKLPLIVFNRGGNGEFGKAAPWQNTWRYALDGFVVIATQLRGSDGGDGKDEFGGADVDDVLNVLPLAESLGVADMRNVFLLGWSRGGMETALALKRGMKVNAAAVGGALSDLTAELARRPSLGTNVWTRLMPDWRERRDALLRERSAVFWPERIRVPLLLIHGGADWRVDPAETLHFAEELQKVGATYELVVYAGDDHGVSMNKDDSNRRIAQWFRRYMVR
jgi:dipeptidyl aminopeptidase/acylaminoacyl peptidase